MDVHVLSSGSHGNCTVIRRDDEAVMVDDGLSGRMTQRMLDYEGIDGKEIKAILLTHEHHDHAQGAGVTARKLGIPIYSTVGTFMNFDHGDGVDFHPFSISGSFPLCGMEIAPLPTNHDAVEPCAFRISEGDRSILYVTDTGKLSFPIEAALADADLAIIEANYDAQMLRDGFYPEATKRRIASSNGHMSNVQTAAAIKRTAGNKDRRIFLAHLSENNNTPDDARQTVSDITGISRFRIDCLEFRPTRDRPGDTRHLTV